MLTRTPGAGPMWPRPATPGSHHPGGPHPVIFNGVQTTTLCLDKARAQACTATLSLSSSSSSRASTEPSWLASSKASPAPPPRPWRYALWDAPSLRCKGPSPRAPHISPTEAAAAAAATAACVTASSTAAEKAGPTSSAIVRYHRTTRPRRHENMSVWSVTVLLVLAACEPWIQVCGLFWSNIGSVNSCEFQLGYAHHVPDPSDCWNNILCKRVRQLTPHMFHNRSLQRVMCCSCVSARPAPPRIQQDANAKEHMQSRPHVPQQQIASKVARLLVERPQGSHKTLRQKITRSPDGGRTNTHTHTEGIRSNVLGVF